MQNHENCKIKYKQLKWHSGTILDILQHMLVNLAALLDQS